MVSKTLKAKYAAEKTKRAGGKILPIFSREHPSYFVNEIMREDEEIRKAVLSNPRYRDLLEQQSVVAFKKYSGVITGAKVVDSWDRVTSAAGLVADAAGVVSAGAGNVISAVEEVAEGIPKGIYALYYLAKTGDWKSIPLWTAYEIASLIPFVGDAIDMTNIYVHRARKMTKEKVKKEFWKHAKSSGLERRMDYGNEDLRRAA